MMQISCQRFSSQLLKLGKTILFNHQWTLLAGPARTYVAFLKYVSCNPRNFTHVPLAIFYQERLPLFLSWCARQHNTYSPFPPSAHVCWHSVVLFLVLVPCFGRTTCFAGGSGSGYFLVCPEARDGRYPAFHPCKCAFLRCVRVSRVRPVHVPCVSHVSRVCVP